MMRNFWARTFGTGTQADAAWVQRCAQSLIRMRPQGDLEQLIETAIDLWPAHKHLDPVGVAHAQAKRHRHADVRA